MAVVKRKLPKVQPPERTRGKTTMYGWHNHTGHILLGHDKRMQALLEGIRALDLQENSVQLRDSKGEEITVIMDRNGVARKK